MKLSNEEKAERKTLKKLVQEYGGCITQVDNFCTIVVVPKLSENSRFCEVAAAYCSESDTWNRKRGEYEALEKWQAGCSINVYMGGRTVEQVAAEFTELLF